ncbi:MAG TPA: class F sortase [Methylomirabilota bacterium]|nr:class F sortase [Methylomirabilota bacterium]
MKKLFFILLIFLFGVGVTIFSKYPSQIQQKVLPTPTQAAVLPSPTITSIQTVALSGQTLSIPKINVSASIESVGMDSQGRMDIPKNADDAAWYNLGVKPGEKGNAVIDGHYDKASGAPAVFYNLTKLHAGDMIIIRDRQSKQYTFAVVRIQNYPYDNFPLQEVFGQSTQPMLNLITCEGTWNKTTKNYSHRTVVFAKLVQ